MTADFSEYIKRILIVGFGSIAKRHLSIVREVLPDTKVAILSNRGLKLDIDQFDVFANIKEAIGFNPDVAILCNPSSYHIDIALELAEAGVHLFIEKPLSHSLDEVEKLRKYVSDKKILAAVGYNLRYKPSLQYLKEIIDSNTHGRVLSVSAEVGQYLPDWRPDVDYRGTVSANSKLGGGALLELSHELDYLRWFFGEPSSVFANIMKVSTLEIDVEDMVEAILLVDNYNGSFPIRVHLDFLQRSPTRGCKVICEQATLLWDGIEGRVDVWKKGKRVDVFQENSERNDTYRSEQIDLYDAIAFGKEPFVTFDDGAAVIKLIDELRESSDKKRVITCE